MKNLSLFMCYINLHTCPHIHWSLSVVSISLAHLLGVVQSDHVVLAAEANQLHHEQQLLAEPQ